MAPFNWRSIEQCTTKGMVFDVPDVKIYYRRGQEGAALRIEQVIRDVVADHFNDAVDMFDPKGRINHIGSDDVRPWLIEMPTLATQSRPMIEVESARAIFKGQAGDDAKKALRNGIAGDTRFGPELRMPGTSPLLRVEHVDAVWGELTPQ